MRRPRSDVAPNRRLLVKAAIESFPRWRTESERPRTRTSSEVRARCSCRDQGARSSRSISASSSSLPASRIGPVNHLRAEMRYQPPNRTNAAATVIGE